MVGFGFTDSPPGQRYSMDEWVAQAIGLLDALEIERADIVGNSFGGALALAIAIRYPQRVRRLVLMGSAGLRFPMTDGLEAVWGYTPSPENMRRVLDIFAFDRGLVTDYLARLRYEASIRPGVQEAFAQMFPPPRQRWIDALASEESAIRALRHETLVVHGREDRVIPLETSLRLAQWIPKAQLHVFGHCGHWTQIEHAVRFSRIVRDFFTEARSDN
jgi:2-hydroxymuconate-semialdehyde hydrolase